ncbi:MAG: hypothetical protein ACLQK4_12305 [Acidimicrobiales bacterium]|jgi:DNA-binding transcriptional regulator of glucitol operon
MKWWSRRAIGLHVAVVIVVAGCMALGWWQLSRAMSGNTLSWVYTFEWPFFAAYGVYMWWKLLHEPVGLPRDATGAAHEAATADVEPVSLADRVQELGFDPYDDEADPELAAYNRYLAGLHAADQQRSTRARQSESAS